MHWEFFTIGILSVLEVLLSPVSHVGRILRVHDSLQEQGFVFFKPSIQHFVCKTCTPIVAYKQQHLSRYCVAKNRLCTYYNTTIYQAAVSSACQQNKIYINKISSID